MFSRIHIFLLGFFCAWLNAGVASAQALSVDLEALLVPNVGAAWVTVETVNTYTDPVVVCTYNLVSAANPPATVRMQNAGATSFQIRIQQFEDSNVVTASDVHCLVADTGVHTLSDGRKLEAFKVLSDGTNGNALGWNAVDTEDVTSTLSHSYGTLVVLGQVMTFADSRATVFWTNSCASRGAPPTAAAVCVGKHIGMINATRNNETLGVIALDAGSGTVNDVDYSFQLGADLPRGTGNAPPYSYNVGDTYDIGVLTQAAEDGGNGGWAVLYGASPVSGTNLNLAIEEETAAGDTSRSHTTENVFYAVFENNQSANVTANKSVETYAGNASDYALPGSDVIYTLSASNAGTAPIDRDTVFLVDSLPTETLFYNGDIDDGGPATSPFIFMANDSGLSFNPATDVSYSSGAAKPTDVSQCTYSPISGYDPNVRHICFSPSGLMNSGTLHTNSSFDVQFRARIN